MVKPSPCNVLITYKSVELSARYPPLNSFILEICSRCEWHPECRAARVNLHEFFNAVYVSSVWMETLSRKWRPFCLDVLTQLGLGDSIVIIKVWFSNTTYGFEIMGASCAFAISCVYHRTPLMISQHLLGNELLLSSHQPSPKPMLV